ncbi:MAG: hypothetical protein RLZZ383_1032 [Pseudomonadota bacterium]
MGPAVITTDAQRPQAQGAHRPPRCAWAGLALAVACAGSGADALQPVDHVSARPPPCVVPGAVVALSPADGADRHHPTADRAPDGTVWVTWQRGMRPAAIEIASFSPSLEPAGPPVLLSGLATRPTHPQVAVGAGRRVVVWTEEDTATLRFVAVDDVGQPLAPPISWAGVRGMPLYPDVAVDPMGVAWVVWFEEAGGPAWWSMSIDTRGSIDGPQPLGEANAWWGGGGPAGVAVAADGRVYAAWAEVAWRPFGAPAATVYASALGEPVAPMVWGAVVGNAQRVALGVDAGGKPAWAGWTRYPGGTATPGVAWTGPGQPVVTRTPGRMLDLLAVGDEAWVAWDAPELGVVAAPATDRVGCAGPWRVADPATHAERPVWVPPQGGTLALVWQAGAKKMRSIYGQTLKMQ